MPRKGENIYKRKDGRWEGRYIKARSKTGKAVYGYVYAPTYKEAKRKRSQQCGLVPVNFHALRHTFATRCIELGFDVKSLSEILGHATVNITLNRYVHPSMELKQQNMQKLSCLLTVI